MYIKKLKTIIRKICFDERFRLHFIKKHFYRKEELKNED